MSARNKKKSPGFTLVELIVTMSILLILAGGLAMISEPAFKTAQASLELSEDRLIAQSIMQQLKREIAAAAKGSVTAGANTIHFRSQTYGNVTVSNTDGRVSVMCGTEEIGLEDGAYMGRTASAGFNKVGDTVTVTVTVYNGGVESYSLEETVLLLNE